MEEQQKVYERLNSLGIKYEVINHPAVLTIEDMEKLEFPDYVDICKNLFVRDAKGRSHYLIVLCKDKRADLKNIAEQIQSTKLSFASDERLDKYLKLKQGEVTPLGVINDTNNEVEVVFDKDLIGKKSLGVHPNDNTATVVLSFEDLKKFVEKNGNTIRYVNI